MGPEGCVQGATHGTDTQTPELCVHVGMQKADLCGLLLVFSRIEDLSHCQAVPEPGSSSALCHLPEETEGLREDAHMSREVSGCKY